MRYYNLLTAGAQHGYLAEAESRAQAPFDALVRKHSEEENLTEKRKASDPTEWVRRASASAIEPQKSQTQRSFSCEQ